MYFQGILFDVNGTVTDILTDEGRDEVWRVVSNFLDYQGISIPLDELRRLYFQLNKQQRKESPEPFPEFDVVALFREIIHTYASDYTRSLSGEKLDLLPLTVAEVFRAASRFRLELYPDVRQVLDLLKEKYRLGVVSDGQSSWGIPELNSRGLTSYFETVVISSDLGCRKPSERLFRRALEEMELVPERTIFVGNDMYRDVFGAHEAGMKTVFFLSNQGEQKESGAAPDYIIYHFSELIRAVEFLEENAHSDL